MRKSQLNLAAANLLALSPPPGRVHSREPIRGAGASVTSRLVEALYESALTPEMWPSVVDEIAAVMKAAALVISVGTQQSSKNGLLTSGVDHDFIDAYQTDYLAADPWSHAFEQVVDTAACLGDRLVPQAELCASRFYRQWMHPQGLVVHGVCAGHVVRGDICIAIRVFHQKVNDALLRRNLFRLSALLPHIGRAFEVERNSRKAVRQSGMLRETLDRLPIGVFLVDTRRCVIEANRSAAILLAREDSLRLDNGRLRLAKPRDTAALVKLMEGLSRGTKHQAYHVLNVSRRPGCRPLSLVVCRVREEQSWWAGPSLLAVFVADPDGGLSIHTSLLRQLHGFSRIQAEVACQLMRGTTLQDIAAQRGVQRSTIRSHVDQLFARTGTRRRAELIHFLLSSPARLLVTQADVETHHDAPKAGTLSLRNAS